MKRTAAAVGLESSLNSPGRPPKRARADREAGGLFGPERLRVSPCPLLRPVLDAQSRNPAEVPDVARNDGRLMLQRDGGNAQVHFPHVELLSLQPPRAMDRGFVKGENGQLRQRPHGPRETLIDLRQFFRLSAAPRRRYHPESCSSTLMMLTAIFSGGHVATRATTLRWFSCSRLKVSVSRTCKLMGGSDHLRIPGGIPPWRPSTPGSASRSDHESPPPRAMG